MTREPYTLEQLAAGAIEGPIDFNRIPQLTRRSAYRVDVSWSFLEQHVQTAIDEDGLNLKPEFQRGHIWTAEQQSRYVEFCLRGGQSGRELLFNCPGWMGCSTEGPYEIVDGLQRLTAVRLFIAGEVIAFGRRFDRRNGFTGRLRLHQGFKWHVNSLKQRHEVLQWYLELNAEGTPHTDAEIERVRALHAKELARAKEQG